MNAITALKGKMPSIPWSKMGKVPALLRREFLDHKIGFFTIPLIVAGLTLFVLLLGLVDQVVIDGKSIVNELENAIVELEDGHVSSQQESKEIVSTIFTGGSALGLIMILPFVVFFGLLASLYDDRKDRSFLFWKSMPVSDATEVLSKFTFLTIGGPFIIFAFMLLLGIATMLVLTPFIWADGGSAWDLLWGPSPFVSMWFALAANYVVYAFWVLPIFAWLMLASAYAPKAPMVFAVVPIIAIVAAEVILGNKSYLAEALLDRIALDYAHIMGDIFEQSDRFRDHVEVNALTIGDAFQALGASFANAKFWVGQLFTGAFMAGAIYLRRYNV